ncbi:MAG TPA: hypothetical protein VMQ10_11085 [Spirochaetia bacterium]|nr:hypothetical protein [Spirochaetia bacterium]
MRAGRAAIATLFSGLIFIQLVAAQARVGVVPLPELNPLPLSQQLASLREPLPVETIVDAALEFSGASAAAASAAKDRLSGLLLKFRGEVADVSDQDALAERALTFLHKNLFTTYSVTQTRVDTALESGVYNCVSSAVLYLALARSVGLSVAGVRTTDHAFDSVLVNGQQLDVETTNPYGFNPGARKEFTDSFGKATGYAYVPPGNYRDRRAIGEKELLSLILYNRVSEYMDGRQFKDALQPAVSAFTLMGSDETRKVMQIAFSNYVTWLSSRQEFAQAAQFMDAVRASFGGTVAIDPSRQELYHNWVVSLIDSRQYADAETLLGQPTTRAGMDDADWTSLSVALVQRQAQAEGDSSGSVAAAEVVAQGLKKLGRQPALLQTYEAYIHNAFAMLYNARRAVDAKAVVDQGLLVYPDSRMLLQDLDLARKALRGSRS